MARMTPRDFNDPQSMVGASRDEVLAMRPPGWLVRPIPGARGGFKLISPGRMPGARGVIAWYDGGRPGLRTFADRPPARVFALNCAVEQSMLVEVLGSWEEPAEGAGAATDALPMLIDAVSDLLRDARVHAYEDHLQGDELTLLDLHAALAAVAAPLNWWRDEADASVPPAESVIVLDITDAGKAELTAWDPRPRRWWRRSDR